SISYKQFGGRGESRTKAGEFRWSTTSVPGGDHARRGMSTPCATVSRGCRGFARADAGATELGLQPPRERQRPHLPVRGERPERVAERRRAVVLHREVADPGEGGAGE